MEMALIWCWIMLHSVKHIQSTLVFESLRKVFP